MILHLILAGVEGFIAGKVMRGKGFGIIVDILLGLAGGWVGVKALAFFRVDVPDWSYFVTALIGACLLVWIVRLIKR